MNFYQETCFIDEYYIASYNFKRHTGIKSVQGVCEIIEIKF